MSAGGLFAAVPTKLDPPPVAYIFAVGPLANCSNYSESFEYLRDQGFMVLCPEVNSTEAGAGWVKKQALVAKWLRENPKFKSVDSFIFGGHSTGAAAALAAGVMAQSDGAHVLGYVMQHPVAISGINIPGECEDPVCKEFFPADFFDKLKGKILITCGRFCDLKGYEHSNFKPLFHAALGEDLSKVDVATVAAAMKPSDCVPNTTCSFVAEKYLKPNKEGGLLISDPGEHVFSVMQKSGLEEETKPFVSKWLKYLAGDQTQLQALRELNGTSVSSKMLQDCPLHWQQKAEDKDPVCMSDAKAKLVTVSGSITMEEFNGTGAADLPEQKGKIP
eukprot:TRINITY_DN19923_c0_g1_i2.p1 TRINITY_DN19923_c0_g1~~TRINITY_DN19923_c0_g1_i2.p1  ORF type:complete len:384 (-),score=134.31 TRINITY_DN19923_c0_g1_i2:86-1081(-)